MNEDTRVSVHCYAGDAHQINFKAMLHHGCPVTLLSPEDSPVTGEVPGVDYRTGGKRAYTGQLSLDRQIEHMRILLTYPENHFLMHDSDSVVLDPELPAELYAEPNIVWSNQIIDDHPTHTIAMPDGWPRVAFQPPYFLSRTTIEKMLAVADDPMCKASDTMPFIDWFMVQLTVVAGLQWRRFNNCMSCQITADPRRPDINNLTPALQKHYSAGMHLATLRINDGSGNILHSVKDPAAVDYFLELRRAFRARTPGTPVPRFIPPPHIGRPRPNNRRATQMIDPRGLKA